MMFSTTRNGGDRPFWGQREMPRALSVERGGKRIRALLRTTTATLGAICVPATMGGLAVGFSQPAWAQAETPAAATTDIVVTGSRIKRPNLESTVPITSVGPEGIVNAGQISVGDQLNQLPQLRSTFSQANSTRFIGTAGQNYLDLRGMGTARTLVLLNGRRFVSSSSGDFEWDVNNVPADLVERVDVVTGGNSAIYGSDAVAGAVNFVLKRKFDGFQVRGQSGISGEGDSNAYFISGIAGKNFAEGRGNITLAAEYARQDALYLIQREQGRDRRQFQLVENTGPQMNPANGALRPGPEEAGGNGIPDTAFIGGLRRVSTSEGGMISTACPTAAAAGESDAAFTARRALTCTSHPNRASTNTLARFGNAYGFMPDGTLLRNPCVTDFRPFGSGNCLGGFGSTLREAGQFQPELKRINATLMARFELSRAFEPFVEAQYMHVSAVQEGAPTFGTNSYSIDNPFLTAQARELLSNILAPGANSFSMDRQNLDFGARGEGHERNVYRIVAGVEGRFNDDWSYEISANYGRFTSYYESEGNYLTSQFERAIDATRNSAGQIVCAVNADDLEANDDKACVPVNLFGAGNVSKQALAYFGHRSSRKQKNEQFIASAFMSGDTSGWLDLPGGPVGFAIGGEYREERQRSIYDAATAAGLTFLNLTPPFAPPVYKVKELFGEVRVPLLSNVPFFDELAIEGAGRVSDYNLGKTGTVFAYNAGLVWAPVRDLKLRAGYQRSVRAPALGDLFTEPTQTFNNDFEDPCGQENINKNPNRVKNCAAAGVPVQQTFVVDGVTTTEPFSNRSTSGLAAASQGNTGLAEERSTSLTLGAIYQPHFLPGFSLSLDYFNITVRNAISTVPPQLVIEQCYDNPSGIDNPFCRSVNRLPNGTLAGQFTVFHAGSPVILNNPGFSSLGRPFNYAKRKASGIDLDLNYRHEFGDDVQITTRAVASYLINRDNYTDISRPDYVNRQKSEHGDPAWRFQISNNLSIGKFSFGHKIQYVGKQLLGEYETFYPLQDRPPLDPDAAPFHYYPAKWYHDFRVEFDAAEKFQLYLGVDNAFDVRPPYDRLGTEEGSLYDPTGRFFYAGFKVKI